METVTERAGQIRDAVADLAERTQRARQALAADGWTFGYASYDESLRTYRLRYLTGGLQDHELLGRNGESLELPPVDTRATIPGRKRRFSDDEVRQIRRLYSTGRITQRRLAERFGCTDDTIGCIVRYVSYRAVPDRGAA